MTHRIREQTNNQTISRRKHNIIIALIALYNIIKAQHNSRIPVSSVPRATVHTLKPKNLKKT